MSAGADEQHTVRVEMPAHLRTLAGAWGEIQVTVSEPITIATVLDELETMHPTLKGTIREYGTGARRAFLRFFVCQEDWSHLPLDSVLPSAVVEGREPLMIIGAIAGG